jgi:hypothetical protein
MVYDLTNLTPSSSQHRVDKAMTQQPTIDQTSAPMMTGTVEIYDSGKGFGFIQSDNGGTGAFVHVSALARAEMPDLVEAALSRSHG